MLKIGVYCMKIKTNHKLKLSIIYIFYTLAKEHSVKPNTSACPNPTVTISK